MNQTTNTQQTTKVSNPISPFLQHLSEDDRRQYCSAVKKMPRKALKIGLSCGLLLMFLNLILEHGKFFKHSIADGFFDMCVDSFVLFFIVSLVSFNVIGLIIRFKYKLPNVGDGDDFSSSTTNSSWSSSSSDIWRDNDPTSSGSLASWSRDNMYK